MPSDTPWVYPFTDDAPTIWSEENQLWFHSHDDYDGAFLTVEQALHLAREIFNEFGSVEQRRALGLLDGAAK